MDKTLLVECAACSGRLSRKAYSCPACGHPNAAAMRAMWAVALLVLAVGMLLMYLRWQGATRENERAGAVLLDRVLREYASLESSGADPKALCGFGRFATGIAEQHGPEQAGPLKARVDGACRQAGI